MPKTNPAEEAPQEQAVELTLQEFCVRESGRAHAVEMLAAFNATEQAAGRVKDTEVNYSARFAAFHYQPA